MKICQGGLVVQVVQVDQLVPEIQFYPAYPFDHFLHGHHDPPFLLALLLHLADQEFLVAQEVLAGLGDIGNWVESRSKRKNLSLQDCNSTDCCYYELVSLSLAAILLQPAWLGKAAMIPRKMLRWLKCKNQVK